jgi:hypothetical protein
MQREIQSRLLGVNRRERLMRSIRWSGLGLFLGSVMALVFALFWRMGGDIAWWSPPLALGVSCLVFGAIGFWLPLSLRHSAASVDAHYQLKDRSLTALEFAEDDRNDPLRKLQVADAITKLDGIDPRTVVPWQRPQWLAASLGTLLAAMAIMLWPVQKPLEASVSPETRKLLDEQARHLDETMLKDLRELADDKDEEEIQKLLKELEELVEDLRDPGVDEREALAKLSLMQQSIASAMAAFNLEQVDQAMQSLAESLESAESLQALAADLKNQDYEEAADQLEQLDPKNLSNKEKRTVAENLKKLSENLAKANQGQMSESTQAMAEGLEKKNDSQCQGAACKLAGLCKTQSLRKSVCLCLGNQLNTLSLCKSACNKNGGNCVSPSDSPSNNWGTGQSNKPFGELATKLDSTRQQVDLTGNQGDGPSEREILTTTEAKQLATRSYKERYSEFKKQAEAVLESEPLPLGYRQTVKQYFENIRPTGEETE